MRPIRVPARQHFNDQSMKTILALLGLAVIAGLVAFQWPIQALRRENGQLTAQAAEVERLTKENEQIERLRAENQDSARLREETRDLHKLRDEVRRLREHSKDLPNLRNENQRLKASQVSAARNEAVRLPEPLAVIAMDRLANAGQATPEAALQTLFWAMRESDQDAVSRCLSPEARKEFGAQDDASLRRMIEEMKAKFKTLRILARKDVSGDEVLVAVQFEVEGEDALGPGAFPLRRVGGEWQVASRLRFPGDFPR